MAIRITDRACEKIKDIIDIHCKTEECKNSGLAPSQIFLRMGVRGGGCSGLSYLLELDTQKGPHDKEFTKGPNEKGEEGEEKEWGFKVVVDLKSYLYLNGVILDYVIQGLVGGFTFINPSAKSTCGCGTSFSA